MRLVRRRRVPFAAVAIVGRGGAHRLLEWPRDLSSNSAAAVPV